MEKNLLVSASPHIRDHITTRRIMLDVVIALTPAALSGIYFFGWKAALLIAVCIVSCVVFEYIMVKIRKKPLSIGDCSAIVTGLLLALSLPPGLPVWMAILGCFIAIVVIKQLFGGIGYNFINPALGARVFMIISFAQAMTTWVEPGLDAVSSATPLAIMKQAEAGAVLPDMSDMLLGNIGGCIGETSVIALLIGAVWLLARTVITWHIPVFYLGSVALLTWMLGGEGVFNGNPLLHLVTGGLLLGAVYMATDYTTTPMTKKGSIIFAIGCGVVTSVIRLYGALPEGVSFAILFMNLLVPLIDRYTIPKNFGGAIKK
ncbi:MAG TPA: Na+-transporting NADH:ubiquinone oxidoreductase subunit D [Clostridiales bacterium]|nr:Na+-transporting NADH:ubiquinone oxidoreductase subunit D [Clostridiales bacterium]